MCQIRNNKHRLDSIIHEIMKVVREKPMFGEQLQECVGRSEFGNINGNYIYQAVTVLGMPLALYMPYL